MNSTSSPQCKSGLSPAGNGLVGWVLESPGRGTLNLIITCLFTIALCTWVVIHPRVHKRPLPRRLHKLVQFVKAIIAPEFIAVEGLQEWTQARKMVKDCEDLTEGEIQLVHAFYIGMLALRYRTPKGWKVIWPNQYTWLLKQGLVNKTTCSAWGFSEDDIRDKSNADDVVKLAALLQVSWFVAQCIMRTAHSLPLSQLESMTLSYVPLFAVTYFFWWLKPKDVLVPSIVDLPIMSANQLNTFESLAVSTRFDNEGTDSRNSLRNALILTPRIFEKEAELKLAHELKRARRYGGDDCPGGEVERDCPHLASKTQGTVVAWWDPDLYHSKIWPVTCLFGASFGALHLVSWYSVFPTTAEQWLWRGAALLSIFSMLVFMQFEKVTLRWDGPLTLISLISPVLYLISRIAMMGGVIAALRASEPGVYDTYVVANYWVHIT